MNKIIILALVVSTFFSCNNKKKAEESKNEINDFFEIVVDFKAEQNDNFQLFYSEEYILPFPEKQSVNRGFLGKKISQSVIFRIPDDIFPVRFRLDVGSNKSQKFIEINSLIIRYAKHEIIISQENILNYLVPNAFLKHDGNIFYVNPIEIDGNMTYDPFFTCTPHLVKLISEL